MPTEAPEVTTVHLTTPCGVNIFTRDKEELAKIREHFERQQEKIPDICTQYGVRILKISVGTGQLTVEGTTTQLQQLQKELWAEAIIIGHQSQSLDKQQDSPSPHAHLP